MQRRLLQVAARNSHHLARQQPTFVCAACRSTQQRPWTRQNSSSSSSSSNSRSSPSSSAQTQQQPQKESVTPQSHYDFFPATFPAGPPPKSPFTPDLKQLHREFLQLQAKTHPDRAPGEQRRQAEALSMRVNEAYRTLQDPLRRAQYLLSLRGIDVEDETAKLEESELLMEVMETREAVDEANSEEELVRLRAENDERIRESVRVMEDGFRDGEMERTAREAVRLRYWMNIDESIRGWEEGVGGGANHH